jgi:NAD(P)-dependent dehydrogenase (short-subunit alcohol dehydrogenase family)
MLDTTRKLAVITGASTGIGLELARECARHGFDLVIAANEPEIDKAQAQLTAEGVKVDAVNADLSNTKGVDNLIEKIGGRPVHALLANAGRGLGKGFLDQDFADIRYVIDTNVTGTVYLIHKIRREMRNRGEGPISLAQVAPAQILKERQDAMEKMWPGFYQDIARTVRSDNPDLTLVATKATEAGEHLKKVAQLFPPGTGHDAVPTSRAKPEIWTQRADFEATLAALAEATKTIGEDAKSGSVDKVKADWTNVAKACGGCHGGPKKAGGKFRFEEG